MIKQKIYVCAAIVLLGTSACQDVISVDLDQGEPLVVVDAWLNNLAEDQTITLQTTQPYFDSTSVVYIDNASVVVNSSSGKSLIFENQGQGTYIWTSDDGETIGEVGDEFELVINANETTYSSNTALYPVCTVDSISQEFRENEAFLDDGIYAQFFARDLEGLGNTYWIKTFKNGVYLNRPLELNIAFDAVRAAGADVDNIIFIPPIREGVNELTNENIPIAWEQGETIRVEIHSISNEAFDFLDLAQRQILNGLSTIFAEPLVNVQGNIDSSDEKEVLGVFNVAAVSSLEEVIK